MKGKAEPEVRPTAFKSMLRYWFRALASGVLPASLVQEWEAQLFGGINPQKQWGWVKVEILEGRTVQKEPKTNREPCGEQTGILILVYSSSIPKDKRAIVATIFKHLTWIMFNLGGIGQGARRPCYSRCNRQYAPWYRGSSLFIESDNSFWNLPSTISEFKTLFQSKLKDFYKSLGQLSNGNINFNKLKTVGTVTRQQWTDAVDANCRIIVCNGQENFGKLYALAVLHSQDLKIINRRNQQDYDGYLCGTNGKPSPVWIADLEGYQVVTVFGANQAPRLNYIQQLRERTSKQNYDQIFPLI